MRGAAVLLALGLAQGTAPAAAQELIPPEEFLDYVEGKVVSFRTYPGGALVGVERYDSRDMTTWQRPASICEEGRITIDGAKICFLYEVERGPVCWWPFRDGDRVLVRHAIGLDGEVQEAVLTPDVPLQCGGVPIS